MYVKCSECKHPYRHTVGDNGLCGSCNQKTPTSINWIAENQKPSDFSCKDCGGNAGQKLLHKHITGPGTSGIEYRCTDCLSAYNKEQRMVEDFTGGPLAPMEKDEAARNDESSVLRKYDSWRPAITPSAITTPAPNDFVEPAGFLPGAYKCNDCQKSFMHHRPVNWLGEGGQKYRCDSCQALSAFHQHFPAVDSPATPEPSPAPDYSQPVSVNLHSVEEGKFACTKCKKPVARWKPGEECDG